MGSRTTAPGRAGLLLRAVRRADREPSPERADPADPGHVAAPFTGELTPLVAVGERVAAGQVLATLEAMKLETPITAPRAGVVERLGVPTPRTVAGGDLVAVLR